MNPTILSAPWAESLDIIDLNPAKKLGINPMGFSAPWDDHLDVISLRPVIFFVVG